MTFLKKVKIIYDFVKALKIYFLIYQTYKVLKINYFLNFIQYSSLVSKRLVNFLFNFLIK